LELLELAAQLCTSRGRADEALGYWLDAVPRLERMRDEGPQDARSPGQGDALAGLAQLGAPAGEEPPPVEDFDARLIQAHMQIAGLYVARQREDAAASHWRRALEVDAHHAEATHALEEYTRRVGRPSQLIELYRDLIERARTTAREVALGRRLASTYAALEMVEEAREALEEVLRLDPEDVGARTELVELLRSAGRYETLREALTELLVRVRDRGARLLLTMELAHLHMDALEQPRQAARSFLEALDLSPSNLAALEGARSALHMVILQEGRQTPSPVGQGNAAQLLERVLQRFADLTEDGIERAQALDEVAALAEWRGDVSAADESRRRARATGDEVERRERKTTTRVDKRLDALLGTPNAPKAPTFRIGAADEEEPEEDGSNAGDAQTSGNQGTPPRASFDHARATPLATDLLPDLARMGLKPEVEVAHSALVPSTDGGEDTHAQDVRTFRERYRDVFKTSGKLPEHIDQESALGRLIQRTRDEAARGERGGTQEPSRTALEHEDVDAAWETVFEQANEHNEITEAADDELDMARMLSNIDRARGAGDLDTLAQAIEEFLALAEASQQDAVLAADQRTALNRELGELLYYELERPSEAKPFLERVRRDDPEGLGAQGSVINALEEIYQAHGQLDQQLALLRQRLAHAQSKDMAATYRLLIAKLLWDANEDREGARRELAPLLHEDPEHDAANRLLAQIAKEAGDWGEAAMRLEVVLRQRAGGLDEVEMERDLGDIYLNHLEQPDAAMRRYESVLRESPADAQALEGVKQAQGALGDWAGYITSLGRELGMLLGRPEGVSLTNPDELDAQAVASPLRTVASQIVSDAAHIAEVELKEAHLGRELWRLAFDLWPEHVEALERCIAIDRATDDAASLAADLEVYADLLLDVGDRFSALLEAAKLYIDPLGEADHAREVLAEGIASVQDMASPPEGLDEARRLMQ
ncbi:MAG: hypothetical protein AAGI01_12725, partial [Myxococcota bacterium]